MESHSVWYNKDNYPLARPVNTESIYLITLFNLAAIAVIRISSEDK